MLMIDPSSLLHRRALAQVVTLWEDPSGPRDLYVPASFVRAVREPDLLRSVQKYFGPRRDELPANEVLEIVRTERLQAYAGAQLAPTADAVVTRLVRTRDRVVRDILIEEWQFLISQSWLIARTRKTFDVFRHGGAVVVDFSGRKFDSLVSQTLHHDRLAMPPQLNNRHRVKAAAKWIAVGGTPVLGLLDPILAAVVGVGTGIFALFDP
jgi:hypothetical protein